MKHTTNFIVYLNELNNVHCAKCKATGRFVKRSIAQSEYDIEYAYKSFSLFVMFLFITIAMLKSVKINLVEIMCNTLETVLKAFKANEQIILFTRQGTFVYHKMFNNEQHLKDMINAGNVSTVRIFKKGN